MFDLADPLPLDADTRIRIPLSSDPAWVERYANHIRSSLESADSWPEGWMSRLRSVFADVSEIGGGVYKVPIKTDRKDPETGETVDVDSKNVLPQGFKVDSESESHLFLRATDEFVDYAVRSEALIAAARWMHGGIWPDGWESGPVACAIVKPLSASERAVIYVQAGSEPPKPTSATINPDDEVARVHRRWQAISDDSRIAIQLIGFEQGGNTYKPNEFFDRLLRKDPMSCDNVRSEVGLHLRRMWNTPARLGKEFAGLSGCAPH